MQNVMVEYNALKMLLDLKSPDFLVKLQVEHFGNEDLKKVFCLVRAHYVERGDFLGWDSLTTLVTAKCKTQDKSRFLADIINMIKQRDLAGLTEDDVVKELEDYRKFRLVVDKSKSLIEAVEQKDIDATIGTIQGMYEDVLNNCHDNLEDSNLASMSGKKIKYMFRTVGLKSLDKFGPIIDGGLVLVAATKGAGKSNFALQCLIHNYLNYEGSCCYYSYELSKEEVRARLLSNIASVNVGNIMSDNLTDEEKFAIRKAELIFLYKNPEDEITEFTKTSVNIGDEEFYEIARNTFERRTNQLYLFDETANWDDLLIRMKLMRDTKNVKMFCIDMPLLVPRGHADRELQDWRYLLKKNQQVKLFAKEDGKKTMVICPVQFNDHSDELRYSTGLADAADLYIAMVMDETDKELGTTTVKFKKFRTFLGTEQPKEFKLLKKFEYSKYESFEW